MLSQDSYHAVNLAFSKQSSHFDIEDLQNSVLQDMRAIVYEHVERFIKPGSNILELNAGTGIDALHFIRAGHRVLATDLSDGMIDQIKRKKVEMLIDDRLRFTQLSFDNLNLLEGEKFDYVFSNMGGLNCIDDLSKVTRHLPALLHPKARATWVVMPPVSPWELLGIFKGNFRNTLRRLRKEGVTAHLEGEYFKTYYHSRSCIATSLGPSFKILATQGLCALTPPPHRKDFPTRYPNLYQFLKRWDDKLNNSFPFNRWADHIMVTFQYNG
jgi:ubiquinone/menaquinone biosynthesis C-methylase UbiE